jgi:hypothetical protein
MDDANWMQMTEPAYPAARAAALRVYPHYKSHLLRDSRDLELLPSVETIEVLIDVGFWASLRREEMYTPQISLAYVAPERVARPLVFEHPVPVASQPLTRLGPAVERPGVHLGVWPRNGGLSVWGATQDLPQSCFVVEVVAPGLLVLKHSRGDDSGKFINVAVLQGEEIKVVDHKAATVPDCPEILTSLMGLQAEIDSPDFESVLIPLAVSMRAHGRGGSLLVVPANSEAWRESILHPIAYSVSPPFRALVDLMRGDRTERSRPRWRDALRSVVDCVAGLTAVDGATVITDAYEVLAFGAKIGVRPGFDLVASVVLTEPIEGTTAALVEPGQMGGTRHLSAAQFAHDQRDAIALVASQDGRFTVFGWSPCEEKVYANRIDTLLL